MIELGAQQAAAVPKFVEWVRRYWAGDRSVNPGFVVFGYAGTGKTTLAKVLTEAAGLSREEVAGGAMQASAASNLGKVTGWDCRTLHRWNYRVEARVGGASWFTFNPESAVKGFRLLVIDEVSQVDIELWSHTLAHGVPVLVLGDPGQIGAVAGHSIATSLTPDVVLTEIHRQAEGNPIIHWGVHVRQGGELPYGDYLDIEGKEVALRKVSTSALTPQDFLDADAILVHRNLTRTQVNQWMRQLLERTSPLPMVGEQVVCRRNQTEDGLVNSFSGEVLEAGVDRSRFSYIMTVKLAETGVIVPRRACSKQALGLTVPSQAPNFLARDLSDITFGYAHTVNAFIGRQARNVLLIDEYPTIQPDRPKWLYTGLTRAVHKMTIAVPDR